MASWATDDEFAAGLGSSPVTMPQGPSFRTPPANSTKSARRSVTPPGPASSPIRMADEQGDRSPSRGSTNDESISILDPRRFTPTLHANLVSEILALRRDQEEKTKQIEDLESTLDAAKGDQERLQGSLTEATKESRSLKRQLSLLEGGTSSALGELQRERDEAVDSLTETKKRLEVAQKKIRSHEDDSQRVHDQWAQDKMGWEDERRKFQRQMHVAESRLKVVLDEVACYQGAHATHGPGRVHDSDGEESSKDNDARSVRTMSITNSIRQSFHSPGPGLHNGHSLADELSFVDDQTDADGRESVLSNYTIPKSPRIHRRNQSLESLRRAGSVARARLFMNQQPPVLEALGGKEEDDAWPATPRAAYTDTGIQYSPPPSPVVRPVKPATPDLANRGRTPDLESPRGDMEIEANQRRKRVSVNRPLRIEPPKPDHKMVSAAAQTMEEPLSPPKTPKTPWRDFTPPSELQLALMMSSSTQTEEPSRPPRTHSGLGLTPPSPPPQIPTISVQPPRSRPTTPREPRLPQHCKDFGCQVNLSPTPTSDAVVQTEGIQIDKRLARLPLHLQPSAISSRPTSPNVHPIPGGLPARNPRRLTQGGDAPETPPSPINSHVEEDDFYEPYPGHDDDGPPPSSRGASTRRSRRLSSLFAGFDTASSDGMDEFGDGDVSDSEFRTALSAPKPQSKSSRPTRRESFGLMAHHPEEPSTSEQPASSELYSTFCLVDKENRFGRHSRRLSRTYEKSPPPPPPVSSSRDGAMRRTALIQSGIASHRNRSRSPSLPDSGNPPFPIPTRASSRKPTVRTRTPSDGQSSPTRGDAWQRRGSGRSSHQTHNLRKVRSAAALPRNSRHRRRGSRSPPPLSPSAETPESTRLPPLPKNDITTPRNRDIGSSGQYRRHRHELSTNTDHTNNTDHTSRTSGAQTTGIVDAIAHTMVGEWMLKYVRRRRSFGVPENTGRDDSSNDRHKRWVWLAPYERAILWSSKQPSSGSALMGKTGRKLTIQSVLDVKDDNPPPKVMPSVFNRSILILTPQRALKFTAVTAERHYLWLTALSFLAHSSQAVPDIFATPQLKAKQQQPLPEFELPRTRFRRGGIRDSIRLAKGKTGNPKSGPPSIPSAPSSKMGDVASFPPNDPCHSREQSQEAAEAPFIPRFSERASQAGLHGRKRSNTGGHVAPPLSFRGFSANASIGTANSSDIYQSQASTNTTWNMGPTSSQPTSEASSRPKNFFDAIGTVRMEAFISPLSFTQFGEHPDEQDEYRQTARRRSKELRRRNSRNRARDHPGSRGREDFFGRGRTLEEDFFRDDPFKGF
ncbi:nuclear migration protein [Hirsutella rhossiliensis]|uniref:Nuclear migration protein n=1 Tax=Hirsutella rhossiliensis TaxID=111463 RepID=A0A9P8SEX2_9HYPO|nr:nuclear migration protein [Hirsutella rhossiliensis]KAH0959479.1 nuclear migration protein [Hirsutella rhossiliensis]